MCWMVPAIGFVYKQTGTREDEWSSFEIRVWTKVKMECSLLSLCRHEKLLHHLSSLLLVQTKPVVKKFGVISDYWIYN